MSFAKFDHFSVNKWLWGDLTLPFGFFGERFFVGLFEVDKKPQN